MIGPCDTTGCPNKAEVHYGLEEFYCRKCHGKHRVILAAFDNDGLNRFNDWGSDTVIIKKKQERD